MGKAVSGSAVVEDEEMESVDVESRESDRCREGKTMLAAVHIAAAIRMMIYRNVRLNDAV